MTKPAFLSRLWSNRPLRMLIVLGGAVTLIFIGIAYHYYDELYKPNVSSKANPGYITIPTGSRLDQVLYTLDTSGYIKDMESLRKAVTKLEYGSKIYPGRFKLEQGMSNKRIVRILAANMQTPVDVVIPPLRTRERLAGAIGKQLEIDSISLLLSLTNEATARQYGFTSQNFIAMFIPNTYSMYWNISEDKFLAKMHKEWLNYWAAQGREYKLSNLGLDRNQVIVLASIITEETSKVDEMPRMAGVYINRLNKNMRLQADPTVRFAVGDFTLKRILNKHLQLKHPYNTYQVQGLPPGPICMPHPAAIDAVLNYEQHDYLFFCARDDFSGYHAFSKTLAQHNRYAQKYQQRLDQMKVY